MVNALPSFNSLSFQRFYQALIQSSEAFLEISDYNNLNYEKENLIT